MAEEGASDREHGPRRCTVPSVTSTPPRLHPRRRTDLNEPCLNSTYPKGNALTKAGHTADGGNMRRELTRARPTQWCRWVDNLDDARKRWGVGGNGGKRKQKDSVAIRPTLGSVHPEVLLAELRWATQRDDTSAAIRSTDRTHLGHMSGPFFLH